MHYAPSRQRVRSGQADIDRWLSYAHESRLLSGPAVVCFDEYNSFVARGAFDVLAVLSVLLGHNAVTIYFSSKQLLPFCFAVQTCLLAHRGVIAREHWTTFVFLLRKRVL